MKEDSTYLVSESTGWIVDWENPLLELCRDGRRGITYEKITSEQLDELQYLAYPMEYYV